MGERQSRALWSWKQAFRRGPADSSALPRGTDKAGTKRSEGTMATRVLARGVYTCLPTTAKKKGGGEPTPPQARIPSRAVLCSNASGPALRGLANLPPRALHSDFRAGAPAPQALSAPPPPPPAARPSHFSLPLELRLLLLLLPLLLLVQAAALAHRAPEDVDAVGRGRGALPLAPGRRRVGGARARARLPPSVPFALPGLGALPDPLLVPRARARAAALLVVLGALGVLGAGRAPAPRPAHPRAARHPPPVTRCPPQAAPRRREARPPAHGPSASPRAHPPRTRPPSP